MESSLILGSDAAQCALCLLECRIRPQHVGACRAGASGRRSAIRRREDRRGTLFGERYPASGTHDDTPGAVERRKQNETDQIMRPSGHFYDRDNNLAHCNTGRNCLFHRAGAAEESPEAAPVEPAVRRLPPPRPAAGGAGWCGQRPRPAPRRWTWTRMTPRLEAHAPSLRQAMLVYDGEANTRRRPVPPRNYLGRHGAAGAAGGEGEKTRATWVPPRPDFSW